MRLVVDTNLMIRALRSPGPARRFFEVAPFTRVLIYHAEQIMELRDVAARPRLGISPQAVDELVDAFIATVTRSNPLWTRQAIAAIRKTSMCSRLHLPGRRISF